MRRADPVNLIALLAMCFGVASCSTVLTPSTASPPKSILQHSVQKRSDGKTVLIVTPAAGSQQDDNSMDFNSKVYAAEFAKISCPRGHDFYADAPLTGRKLERTFVFQCK